MKATYTLSVTFGESAIKRDGNVGATFTKLSRSKVQALVTRMFDMQYDRPETITITTARP